MTPTKKQELEDRKRLYDSELFKILETALRLQGVNKPLTDEFYSSLIELDHYLQEEVERASPLKLRRMILRFYASMQDRPYDSVVDEYLGKRLELDFDERELVNNKLYMATEAAIASYLAPPQQPVKEKE